MGHTTNSQRRVAESILDELKQFRKILRGEDRQAYDRVISRCWKHFGAISYVDSYHTWAFLLMAMLIEQEKLINE